MSFPSKIYDISYRQQQLLPESDRGEVWNNGWVFGRPPGLRVEQWPLSEKYGFPLRHAFTLRVPPEYRAQGEDYVALSVFVDDQLEECEDAEGIHEYMTQTLNTQPCQDKKWEPFWKYQNSKHPETYLLKDMLGCEYAVIWLTEQEFQGALTSPPDLSNNELLSGKPVPGWLKKSSEDYYGPGILKMVNEGRGRIHWMPGTGLGAAFPVELTEFANGPGIEFYGRNHFGGAMSPIEDRDALGPFSIEFNEWFGGFNFGDGIGQIDLETMKLEWACD